MATWKELEAVSAFNTNIAATTVEQIRPTSRYLEFNRLTITNRDTVPIQIRLNGQNTSGRFFELPENSTFTIEPDEGIWFSFVVQQNAHASTAETADKILFRFANCVRVSNEV